MTFSHFLMLAFTSTMRAGVYTYLFTKLMTPRLSIKKTYVIYLMVELILGTLVSVTNLFNEKPTLVYILNFMVALPLTTTLPYKGRLSTRFFKGSLGLVLCFSSAAITTLPLALMPKDFQYAATHTYDFIDSFSTEYFYVAVWMFYSLAAAFIITWGFLKLFNSFYMRIKLPNTTKFILIPLIQALLLAFLQFLYFVPDALNKSVFSLYNLPIAALAVLCDIFLFIILNRMDYHAKADCELMLAEQEMNSAYKKYLTVASHYKKHKIYRHDLNNRISTVILLQREGHDKEASELLEKLISTVP